MVWKHEIHWMQLVHLGVNLWKLWRTLPIKHNHIQKINLHKCTFKPHAQNNHSWPFTKYSPRAYLFKVYIYKVNPITLYKTCPPSTNQSALYVNSRVKSILQKVALTNLHNKAYNHLQNNHLDPFTTYVYSPTSSWQSLQAFCKIMIYKPL